MPGVRIHSFRLIRFGAALLLLSCMSPSRETPASRANTFASFVESIPGQVSLIVSKSGYTLTLRKGGLHLKTYRAAFGRGYADGDKRSVGDKRTPEGDFYICTMHPSERFYKFLGISYPGMKQAEYGLQSRMISPLEYESIRKAVQERQPPPWSTRLGGAVGIHGRMPGPEGLSSTDSNWTDGCIALDNADLDEIASVVGLGTVVTILP